eukprot:m.160350 g.160350  ORF g.160350 m.160350 type:complete len:300 (+) comp18022_c0_seq1:262-1161(+)
MWNRRDVASLVVGCCGGAVLGYTWMIRGAANRTDCLRYVPVSCVVPCHHPPDVACVLQILTDGIVIHVVRWHRGHVIDGKRFAVHRHRLNSCFRDRSIRGCCRACGRQRTVLCLIQHSCCPLRRALGAVRGAERQPFFDHCLTDLRRGVVPIAIGACLIADDRSKKPRGRRIACQQQRHDRFENRPLAGIVAPTLFHQRAIVFRARCPRCQVWTLSTNDLVFQRCEVLEIGLIGDLCPRSSSRHELPHQDPKAIDVDLAMVGGLPQKELWGHVLKCSHKGSTMPFVERRVHVTTMARLE